MKVPILAARDPLTRYRISEWRKDSSQCKTRANTASHLLQVEATCHESKKMHLLCCEPRQLRRRYRPTSQRMRTRKNNMTTVTIGRRESCCAKSLPQRKGKYIHSTNRKSVVRRKPRLDQRKQVEILTSSKIQILMTIGLLNETCS